MICILCLYTINGLKNAYFNFQSISACPTYSLLTLLYPHTAQREPHGPSHQTCSPSPRSRKPNRRRPSPDALTLSVSLLALSSLNLFVWRRRRNDARGRQRPARKGATGERRAATCTGGSADSRTGTTSGKAALWPRQEASRGWRLRHRRRVMVLKCEKSC